MERKNFRVSLKKHFNLTKEVPNLKRVQKRIVVRFFLIRRVKAGNRRPEER